jgi:hypothetical protein
MDRTHGEQESDPKPEEATMTSGESKGRFRAHLEQNPEARAYIQQRLEAHPEYRAWLETFGRGVLSALETDRPQGCTR